MKQPTSMQKFVDSATQMKGSTKRLYVSQSNYTPKDEMVSDEDTAGSVTMQLVQLLACTKEDAIYWAEPVSDSGELERLNIKLKSLHEYSRHVVTVQEFNKKKNETGLHENSIQRDTHLS